MENGSDDFVLEFLYKAVSQNSVFCWKLIVGASLFLCVFWWLAVFGWFFFQFFCCRIARGLQIRNADEQMCVGRPFLGALHFQERMGRAHLMPCSGGRLHWQSVACLPPPGLHQVHFILCQPKNSQGPRRRIQGGRQLILWAQSSPRLWLVASQGNYNQKRQCSPLYFTFFTS